MVNTKTARGGLYAMHLSIADCRLATGDWFWAIGRYGTEAVATAFSFRKARPSTIKSNKFSTRVSSVPTISKAVATAPVPYRDANWQSPIANRQGFVLGLLSNQKGRKTFGKQFPKQKHYVESRYRGLA
jgi:hypothetical protein